MEMHEQKVGIQDLQLCTVRSLVSCNIIVRYYYYLISRAESRI